MPSATACSRDTPLNPRPAPLAPLTLSPPLRPPLAAEQIRSLSVTFEFVTAAQATSVATMDSTQYTSFKVRPAASRAKPRSACQPAHMCTRLKLSSWRTAHLTPPLHVLAVQKDTEASLNTYLTSLRINTRNVPTAELKAVSVSNRRRLLARENFIAARYDITVPEATSVEANRIVQAVVQRINYVATVTSTGYTGTRTITTFFSAATASSLGITGFGGAFSSICITGFCGAAMAATTLFALLGAAFLAMML